MYVDKTAFIKFGRSKEFDTHRIDDHQGTLLSATNSDIFMKVLFSQKSVDLRENKTLAK